ncbi:hypothetical protein [Silanimonas lenta]|uniref:hypothetical protein n=1 Tax=Silanimonas lenta TaxID=265429 RepID=UPI002FE3995F
MRAVTVLLLALGLAAASGPVLASPAASAAPQAEAPRRFDGRSAAVFAESRARFEEGMGDAARLAFHMRLAQVRAKLAEQRGRPLTDAEFAAALDGRTLDELDTLAEAAPAAITIEIETRNDT